MVCCCEDIESINQNFLDDGRLFIEKLIEDIVDEINGEKE